MLRVHEDMKRHINLNLAVRVHSHWILNKELDQQRLRMAAMKAEYM
jgi:hypothetical protein